MALSVPALARSWGASRDPAVSQPGRVEWAWDGGKHLGIGVPAIWLRTQITIAPPGEQRVIVADTNNDRVLIWNSFPTRNGQPADVVLKNNGLIWPWGLWTDGARLVVSCTGSSP